MVLREPRLLPIFMSAARFVFAKARESELSSRGKVK